MEEVIQTSRSKEKGKAINKDGAKLIKEVGASSKEETVGDNSKEGMDGDSNKEGEAGDSNKEGEAGDSNKEGEAGDSKDVVGKEIMDGAKVWVLWEVKIIGAIMCSGMIGYKSKEKGINSTFLVQDSKILM